MGCHPCIRWIRSATTATAHSTLRVRGASSAVLTCSSVTAWCSPRRIEPLGSIRAHLLDYRSHALGAAAELPIGSLTRSLSVSAFASPFMFGFCSPLWPVVPRIQSPTGPPVPGACA